MKEYCLINKEGLICVNTSYYGNENIINLYTKEDALRQIKSYACHEGYKIKKLKVAR